MNPYLTQQIKIIPGKTEVWQHKKCGTLKKNIGEYLPDLCVGKYFLNKTQNVNYKKIINITLNLRMRLS